MNHTFKGYLIEFFIVFIGIVASFFIDAAVKMNEKVALKNVLLEEFLLKVEEDIEQLKNIQEILARCKESSDILIEDFYNQTLSEDNLANEYLYLSQNMGISFYPQNGLYEQLLESGKIELIVSSELRILLSTIYEHYEDRNSALTRTLDDFFLTSFTNVANDIIVFSQSSSENQIIYSGTRVKTYDISSSYYTSRDIPAFYSESQNLIRFYADLMDNYAKGFKELKLLIKEELRFQS